MFVLLVLHFLCCFCQFLLLPDAIFSCCVLFFLLFVLLLLPLLQIPVVFGVAFVAAVFVTVFPVAFAALLQLLRVLSGRQPLKSEFLPAFDLPKCFCR